MVNTAVRRPDATSAPAANAGTRGLALLFGAAVLLAGCGPVAPALDGHQRASAPSASAPRIPFAGNDIDALPIPQDELGPTFDHSQTTHTLSSNGVPAPTECDTLGVGIVEAGPSRRPRNFRWVNDGGFGNAEVDQVIAVYEGDAAARTVFDVLTASMASCRPAGRTISVQRPDRLAWQTTHPGAPDGSTPTTHTAHEAAVFRNVVVHVRSYQEDDQIALVSRVLAAIGAKIEQTA